MAEVTVTFKDSPTGAVQAVMTPSAESIISKSANSMIIGGGLSPSESYALLACNMVRLAAKRPEVFQELVTRIREEYRV